MKERLTKKERDTEIIYDQSDAPMQIRTHDLNLIRRLIALCSEYPETCRLVDTDPISGTYFEVTDKSRVSIHVTKPYPAERRRRQSEWAKEHGLKGNSTANGQNVHEKSIPHFEELSRTAANPDFVDLQSD